MYYFIVNPNSRCGRGEKIWRKLERRMENYGIEYEVKRTRAPGDAARFALELTEDASEPRVIVAVGGDGTINEVLNGISLDGKAVLGYIPTGSGNDLARSLKLSKNPMRCLGRVLNPAYVRCLDYGILSYENEEPVHRRFAVSSGIGLDAAVAHGLLASSGRKHILNRLLGRFRYLLIGIKHLILAKPVKGYVLLDGVKKVEFNHIYFVSAHIHPSEGGGFRFAPGAVCDDGRLEVCVVHNSSKRKLVSVLIDAYFGRTGHHRGVRFYSCKEVSIHLDRPMPVHTDGESCLSQTDIHLRCVEKKLRMIM